MVQHKSKRRQSLIRDHQLKLKLKKNKCLIRRWKNQMVKKEKRKSNKFKGNDRILVLIELYKMRIWRSPQKTKSKKAKILGAWPTLESIWIESSATRMPMNSMKTTKCSNQRLGQHVYCKIWCLKNLESLCSDMCLLPTQVRQAQVLKTRWRRMLVWCLKEERERMVRSSSHHNDHLVSEDKAATLLFMRGASLCCH